MRVAAHEVEGAIVDRLQLVADDPELLDTLTAETNRRLQQCRPKLQGQTSGFEKDLKEVRAMADKLLIEMVSMDQQAGQSFLKDKLNELGQQQLDLEQGLAEVHQELGSMELEAVEPELVRATLGQVKELFGALKPYEQLVLQRAEVNEREITLEVYALPNAKLPGKEAYNGEVVRMRPDWLPR